MRRTMVGDFTRRTVLAVSLLGLTSALLVVQAKPSHAAALQFTSISSGQSYNCGVATDTVAYCWGLNANGQLGDNTTTSRSVPTPVVTGQTFVSVSAGVVHSCALTAAGAAYCWGWNGQGGLGLGDYTFSNTPLLVTGGHTWRSISAGNGSTCGVTTSDVGYCWGGNSYGQRGDGGTATTPTPTLVSGGISWSEIRISVAGNTTCGVDTSNNGYCWGSNWISQVGDAGTSDVLTPYQLAGAWQNMSPGSTFTCGVRTNGDGYCWGQNSYGQLGVGDTTDRTALTLVTGGHSWASISTGLYSTCGVRTNQAAYCWGDGSVGAIGDGASSNDTSPSLVSGSHTYITVMVGDRVVCARDTNSIGYCWGSNNGGAVGQSATSPSSYNTPQSLFYEQVTSTTSVTVEASFVFTVGSHAGACNGVAQSGGATSSATTVSLGHVSPAVNVIGAQDLSVATNSGGGFAVYLRSPGAPSDGLGHALADVSGTYASPVDFSAAGVEAFGFTTSEAVLPSGTANRFTSPSAKWAAMPVTNSVVSYSATTPSTTDTICVAYQAGQSTSTIAGSYSAIVIYIAVPSY